MLKRRTTRAQTSRLVFAPLALGTMSALPKRPATIADSDRKAISTRDPNPRKVDR